MNISNHSGKATGVRLIHPVLLAVCGLALALAMGGCADQYYAGQPVYGPGYAPQYGYGPRYGPGYYGPGYGYPGSVAIEIGDRPYYNRGAGYYVGRSYYVWRPGHWRTRNGQRVWIHGHYVLR